MDRQNKRVHYTAYLNTPERQPGGRWAETTPLAAVRVVVDKARAEEMEIARITSGLDQLVARMEEHQHARAASRAKWFSLSRQPNMKLHAYVDADSTSVACGRPLGTEHERYGSLGVVPDKERCCAACLRVVDEMAAAGQL